MYVPGITAMGGGAWNRNGGGSGTFIPMFTLTPAGLSIGSPVNSNKNTPKKKTTLFFINIEDLLENVLPYPL